MLAALGAAGYAWREPLRLAGLVLTGRSPHCPLQRAIRATAIDRETTAAKDRILAASRLVASDAEGLEHWETPQGRFWIPAGNIFHLAFNVAEQELGIYTQGDITVREGDIVLDGGANVGVYTRQALAAGAKLVVAIEPAPRNLTCLGRNLATEIEQGRVIVYPKGVWDADATLALHVDPENTAAASFVRRLPGWTPAGDLPLTTIDQIVNELALPRVDFIKLDIEGAEPKAIEGGRRTPSGHKPRLAFSVYHAAEHPRVIPELTLQANPAYRMVCGQCRERGSGIRPSILFFE
ncbi:MAG: FkbM family methyltransferase [bacterium]|nr:FkbM family methyltransferase [bacterium]